MRKLIILSLIAVLAISVPLSFANLPAIPDSEFTQFCIDKAGGPSSNAAYIICTVFNMEDIINEIYVVSDNVTQNTQDIVSIVTFMSNLSINQDDHENRITAIEQGGVSAATEGDRILAFEFNEATMTCHGQLSEIHTLSEYNLPYYISQLTESTNSLINRNDVPFAVLVSDDRETAAGQIETDMYLTDVEFTLDEFAVEGILNGFGDNVCNGSPLEFPTFFEIDATCNLIDEPFTFTALNHQDVIINGTMNTGCSEKN